jgi:1-acyl-sn-glycerol-3-phosphate acyltransferase
MYIIKLTLFSIFTLILASILFIFIIILYPWHNTIGPVMLQFYGWVCLRIFRVTIEQADTINISDLNGKGIILIPNHVCVLDVFLIAALYRTVYVSKTEVRDYPIIGHLAWLIGIIFLQRDSVGSRYRVLREVVRKAKGRRITIFAQGTTGSIVDHLPFECGVFKTVEMDHDIILFPVTIHYKEDSEIAWTGEKTLIDNLINICAQKRIHVKVTVHEQISIDDYHDKTSDEICANVQDKILTKLKMAY